MKEYTDNFLNRYIDGEISGEELIEFEKDLTASEVLQQKLASLKLVHENLKHIESYNVSSGFTAGVMKKISGKVKARKSDKYFIFSITSIFILSCIVIVGFLISLVPGSTGKESSSISLSIEKYTDSFVYFLKQIFSPDNVTLIGTLVSLWLLVSAYFFFENLKHAKEKSGKFD